MIGFARIHPTIRPWNPVSAAPNNSAPINAGMRPAVLRSKRNTTADDAAVPPNANDITLPLMVINVIPADKQPITEAVVSSAVKLGADRKLGVKAAQINSAISTTARVTAIRVRANPPKCARTCSQL
jgi:hypothetical protein